MNKYMYLELPFNEMLKSIKKKHGNLCLRCQMHNPVSGEKVFGPTHSGKYMYLELPFNEMLMVSSLYQNAASLWFVCLMVFNATFNNISVIS
jgi:hypothetical protein